MKNIWNDTKHDAAFLEKYSYIEWEYFKSLNESPAFLQTMSVINMASPVLSFIIPCDIFLIFPFYFIENSRSSYHVLCLHLRIERSDEESFHRKHC